jgi:hypothetical protein
MEERGPVELVRDVVGGLAEAWGFLFVFGVSIALVVMGNTLARVIGAGLIVLFTYWTVRFIRRWRAR